MDEQHANAQRLREGYEAFGKGELHRLDDLFAEDVVWHSSGDNQLAGTYRGRADVYERFFGRLMQVTEGSFRTTVRKAVADDDDGVVLTTMAMHRGDEHCEAMGADIFRFSGGRVVEAWPTTTDPVGFDRVLG